MQITCSDCEMYRSSHCQDCLVTALLDPSDEGVELDEALAAPLDLLSGAGLVPRLKFRPRKEPVAESPPDAGSEIASAG